MKKDTTNDMTVGSPVSLIIKFMIPMCLGNLFQQFYNIADSIVAGKFIGVNALAAIGSTLNVMASSKTRSYRKHRFTDVFCDRLAEWTQQWICDYRSPDVRSEKI